MCIAVDGTGRKRNLRPFQYPLNKIQVPMKKLIVSLIAALAATGSLFAQDAKPAAEEVTKLMLGVVPNVMQFDKKELTVKAGTKVMLLFRNEKCPLQHNFLLLKPGTKDAVGALADKMLTDPEALKKLYLPESADILVKPAKLIGIGQSDLIEFTAPAEAGDYPYICTFPGHWRLMNGVLKVTK